ncbi:MULTISPECIES: FHA domain-containing protein [unclassified Microbacterium]|uniref:FHA domain-containing protein n=1 Tax=unclassified Microbacterium TaxID=2609290 RepID=UPI00214B3582|nr:MULTISPECIES: FHA domain-containing protein [unclassified Microbacterium]MCR2784270.1 DUF5684 domain-containing protein [Microbacterium sp. zg.B96]WIM14901.1 DUF5684 domain-containing protein [Microbacterium sp. zg-B96]
MTGLVGTAADAAAAALAYYGGGMGGQTPVILTILQLVLAIGIYVWVALALTAVFRKVGQATWKAWVPVVNVWTLFTLAGMRGWWAAVLAGAGVVAAVASIVVAAVFAGAAVGAAGADDAGAATGSLVAAIVVPALIWLVYGVLALILQIRMLIGVNRGFGLGAGHIVLGVLLFPVWASLVGWGSARWIGLPPKVAQPTLTAPPAPPAASPFTLGAPAAPLGAPPHGAPPLPAAPLPAPGPLRGAVPPGAAPAVPAPAVPSPPAIGGNPWAPPPPPAPASSSRPAAPAAPPVPPVVAAAPVAAVAATPVSAAAPPVPVPAALPTPVAAVDQVAADDLDERTVLAARRIGGWSLALPGGARVALTADTVVLGRNPVAPGEHAGAQVVAVDDATRTVSKTHALLQRRDAGWVVTDLASTNGVFLGDESEVAGSAGVSDVFFLGDARLELHADT